MISGPDRPLGDITSKCGFFASFSKCIEAKKVPARWQLFVVMRQNLHDDSMK